MSESWYRDICPFCGKVNWWSRGSKGDTETPNPKFEAKQDKIASRNFYSIRAKFYDMFKISGDFGDEDMIRTIFEKLSNSEVKMFKEDDKRELKHYNNPDLINVRANKDGLQFCIFQVNKKTGGYKILNEGYLAIGKVMSFVLTTPTFSGDKEHEAYHRGFEDGRKVYKPTEQKE